MKNKFAKYSAAISLLKVRFFKRSCPTMASWKLTNRCNQSCANCYLWKINTPELTLSQIRKTTDKLFLAGVRFISFTGGEPLLRNDIKEIMSYAASKGIYISLNSNGSLLEEKIECLNYLGQLHLSLDGPPEINDRLRSAGSFDNTVKAISIAKDRNIAVSVTTVLSKENLDSVGFLLSFAKEQKVKISFQPASQYLLGSDEKNFLTPIEDEYRKAITFIIDEKRSGNKYITNSITGLRHLFYFPSKRDIYCLAGGFMLRVDVDGTIFSCGWGADNKIQKPISLEGLLLKQYFGPINCSGCWRVAAVELNLIGSLKIEPIMNAFCNL